MARSNSFSDIITKKPGGKKAMKSMKRNTGAGQVPFHRVIEHFRNDAQRLPAEAGSRRIALRVSENRQEGGWQDGSWTQARWSEARPQVVTEG